MINWRAKWAGRVMRADMIRYTHICIAYIKSLQDYNINDVRCEIVW